MWQQTFSPKDVAANLLLQNMRQHTHEDVKGVATKPFFKMQKV
jgi:hypothetical protein